MSTDNSNIDRVVGGARKRWRASDLAWSAGAAAPGPGHSPATAFAPRHYSINVAVVGAHLGSNGCT